MSELKQEVALTKDESNLPAQSSQWSMDWRLANILAKSSLAPVGYKGKPEDCFVAIQLGHEIGLKPMQAIQNICVINGKPCVYGDGALALVRNMPDFEWFTENEPKGNADTDFAEAILKRKDQPEIRRTFSWGDAKRAGLLGKPGPWTTYPKRMLAMRARGFCLRDGAADALKGLITTEEALDYPTVKYAGSSNGSNDLMPKRLSEKVEAIPEPNPDIYVNDDDIPVTGDPIQEQLSLDDQPEVSPGQIKRLFAIASANNVSNETIKKLLKEQFGHESTKDLTRKEYDEFIDILQTGK
jgi:hypothetical protein